MSEPSSAPVILEATDIRVAADRPPINLSVREGEIVGLAGVDGQGEETFLEIMCGLQAPQSGEVTVHSPQGQTIIRSFHQAVKAGLAYLPRNRKTQGILPALSVLDNFSIATLPSSSQFGIFNRRAYLQ